jgi:apolipoprotein N-acyltransferase
VVGVGLNYAPLSWYAIRFSRPGALDAEIVGVDVPTMLRRYGLWQLWVFVPLSLVVLDMRDRLAGRRAGGR